MAVREIVVFPDDRLREPTTEVTEFNDELKALIKDMFDSMYHYDGIGLAAPQIGVNKKMVVIDIPEVDEVTQQEKSHQIVLINPVIVEKKGTVDSEEGCLSVPDYRDKVKRAEWVKVKALDADGVEQVYESDGLFAICMQHEIDHLEGHLFVDYLSSLKREKVKKKMAQWRKEHQQD